MHGGASEYILQGVSEALDEFLVEYLRANEQACGSRRFITPSPLPTVPEYVPLFTSVWAFEMESYPRRLPLGIPATLYWIGFFGGHSIS